jgi:hypothetical protein
VLAQADDCFAACDQLYASAAMTAQAAVLCEQ